MTADDTSRQPDLPPAYRLLSFDEIDSTNSEARRQALAGAEDGTLIWALRQTKGRGRQARSWSSPPGNLYISLVLRPDCSASQAAQLSFVAALALYDAIGSLLPPAVECHLKWPNDVLVGERKIAGILLESQLSAQGGLEWLILGIGLNVGRHPQEARVEATSLQDEGSDRSVDVVIALEAVARHFLTWVNRWLEDGFEPIRSTWLQRAFGLGKKIDVRLPKETLTGVFLGLDEDGALILQLPMGEERRISAGDVYFQNDGS